MEQQPRTDQEKPAAKAKTPKTRSPAYPAVRLEKAIEAVKQIYEKERQNLTTPQVAFQHMGVTSKSSQGLLKLAALKKYGLVDYVEVDGKIRVKVSALGRILSIEDIDPVVRAERIREAAMKPAIYKRLIEQYPGGLPSDLTLRTDLIQDEKQKFNENAVDAFIRDFRATLAFAGISGSGMAATGNVDTEPEDNEPEEPMESAIMASEELMVTPPRQPLASRQPSGSQPSQVQLLTLVLKGNIIAKLSIPFPVSKETFDSLKKQIESLEDGLVEERPANQEKGF